MTTKAKKTRLIDRENPDVPPPGPQGAPAIEGPVGQAAPDEAPKPHRSTPAGRSAWCKVGDLRTHPEQDRLFRPLTGDAWAAFLADIRETGILVPLEITADLTVVDGHQRLRAARELGFEEVEVRIRDDLDEHGVDCRHVEANLNRRQLDALDRARLFTRLLELEAGRSGGTVSREELRERVGDRIGMSGRNLMRYVRLIELPMEIQAAFSEGKITLNAASRVAYRLPERRLAEVAEAIRAGQDAAKVVREALKSPPRVAPAGGPREALAVVAKALKEAEGSVRDLGLCTSKLFVDERVLKKGRRLIDTLEEYRDSVRAFVDRFEKRK